jgi:prevent-host-death family protein
MDNLFTVSEAKAKFSEIINRIIYRKDRIIVTKKGKKVAMVIPLENNKEDSANGLLRAKGALSGIDKDIDEMVNSIYEARNKEKGREVKL